MEPFVAELSAQLDRVAAQNKQLITIAVQHSDDIQFLLHEVGDLKLGQAKLEQSHIVLETKVDGLAEKVDGLETKVDGLASAVDGLETKFDGLAEKVDGLSGKFDGLASAVDGLSNTFGDLSGKVDLIIQIIQSGGGNGRSGE